MQDLSAESVEELRPRMMLKRPRFVLPARAARIPAYRPTSQMAPSSSLVQDVTLSR